MVKQSGRESAAEYLHQNLHALEQFAALAEEFPCDFERLPSIIYSLEDEQQLRHEAEIVKSLGYDAQFTLDTPLPFSVTAAVAFPNMAQFHPLKFLYGVAKPLHILENTFVRSLKGTTALTDYGEIHAKRIVIATHYPFLNRYGLFPAKLYQERSYVQVLEGVTPLGCTSANLAQSGIYLRSYNNLLLVGGGDQRTGKTDGFRTVESFIRHHYPQKKVVYSWANQDCISLDNMPYIGPYSPSLPNVYVATGFNGWGMTSSMIAANILIDLLCHKSHSAAELFKPQRSILHRKLFGHLASSAIDFLVPTTKRCPHLGCALKWNAAEHSWDCPCHGSRFDEHGKLIDNPAMKDRHIY